MNLLNKVVVFLQGKKSYIMAAVAVLDGLYRFFVQHGVSRQSLVSYLVAGGGLAALRAAISKKS